ncbi:MAG: hypothetical protein R3F60_02690 [bacterium]
MTNSIVEAGDGGPGTAGANGAAGARGLNGSGVMTAATPSSSG